MKKSPKIINKMAIVDAKFVVSATDLSESLKRVGVSSDNANKSLNHVLSSVNHPQKTNHRELKFRFWDGEKFIYISLESLLEEMGQQLEGNCFPFELIPQQFTGLKDKNGKEIYEGDILESGYREPKKICNRVVFDHGSFYFSGNTLSQYVIIEKIMRVPAVEIIGNIFENPELLNNIN
jgi:hypothetical protein